MTGAPQAYDRVVEARRILSEPAESVSDGQLLSACDVLLSHGDWLDVMRARAVQASVLDRAEAQSRRAAMERSSGDTVLPFPRPHLDPASDDHPGWDDEWDRDGRWPSGWWLLPSIAGGFVIIILIVRALV